jgi:hypothetical protein
MSSQTANSCALDCVELWPEQVESGHRSQQHLLTQIEDLQQMTKTTTEPQSSAAAAPARKLRVGTLTLTGEAAAGLLAAQCDCGFPAVIVPEAIWGQVLGCAVCHPKEAARIARDQEYAQRQREAEERDRKRQAQQIDLNFAPHFEDLDGYLRRLFRRMAESPSSFSVEGVAQLMRSIGGNPGAGRDDAWEAIFAMLEANSLVELRGPMAEARKYSAQVPYSLHVSPDSRFKVRSSAVLQMEKADAEAAARKAAAALAADAPSTPKPDADPNLEQVKSFLHARCHVDPSEAVSEVLMRVRYVAWEQDRHVEPLDVQEFKSALACAGHPVKSGKYRGLRLKLVRELEAETAAAPASESTPARAASHQ